MASTNTKRLLGDGSIRARATHITQTYPLELVRVDSTDHPDMTLERAFAFGCQFACDEDSRIPLVCAVAMMTGTISDKEELKGYWDSICQAGRMDGYSVGSVEVTIGDDNDVPGALVDIGACGITMEEAYVPDLISRLTGSDSRDQTGMIVSAFTMLVAGVKGVGRTKRTYIEKTKDALMNTVNMESDYADVGLGDDAYDCFCAFPSIRGVIYMRIREIGENAAIGGAFRRIYNVFYERTDFALLAHYEHSVTVFVKNCPELLLENTKFASEIPSFEAGLSVVRTFGSYAGIMRDEKQVHLLSRKRIGAICDAAFYLELTVENYQEMKRSDGVTYLEQDELDDLKKKYVELRASGTVGKEAVKRITAIGKALK